MKDPEFPGRPDHPDFWLIAGITARNDEIADNSPQGKSILDVVAATGTDPASVAYTSVNRAAKLAQVVPEDPKLSRRRNRVLFGSAMWMDGFLVGIELARKRAEVDDLEEGLEGP